VDIDQAGMRGVGVIGRIKRAGKPSGDIVLDWRNCRLAVPAGCSSINQSILARVEGPARLPVSA
jgi:hypothetical protein